MDNILTKLKYQHASIYSTNMQYLKVLTWRWFLISCIQLNVINTIKRIYIAHKPFLSLLIQPNHSELLVPKEMTETAQ